MAETELNTYSWGGGGLGERLEDFKSLAWNHQIVGAKNTQNNKCENELIHLFALNVSQVNVF